ncbi:MAG: TRAP transporter TatT component family protein [Pyrinomonadaceae bacterium]
MRISYISFAFVITLGILTSCDHPSETDAGPVIAPQLTRETIAAADELFGKRGDPENLRKSIELLAQLRNPDNRVYEVEWKFAKYSCFLGRTTANAEEKEQLFENGEKAAQIAIRLKPDRPEGHFWYGANLGEASKLNPITVGLRSLDKIRDAMNEVIRIDPGYQGASAYDVLAQIELGTGLAGGKAEKAVEYLEHALTIEKSNSNLRLNLAKAYLALKQRPKARNQLTILINMDPHPEFLSEHAAAVAEAKDLLDRRF